MTLVVALMINNLPAILGDVLTHIPQIFKQKERKIDSGTQNSQTIAVQSFGSF